MSENTKKDDELSDDQLDQVSGGHGEARPVLPTREPREPKPVVTLPSGGAPNPGGPRQ